MMSKMKCFGALAGCALATGALYATTPYTATFESGSDSWVGGTPTTSTYTFNAACSYPITNATHTKVLVIEGSAAYTNATAFSQNLPLVDMMVQTARPDDDLGFPSSEVTNDIQIAVAVDSNGCFNAYCKNKSGAVGWYPISAQYDAAGWARVSFLFDYTNKRCQIRIDGEPKMSTYGYVKADSAAGDTNNGAWYNLAKNDASGVSNMKVIGCTAIDDVVMNDDADYTYPLPAAAAVGGVPCSWYDDYGIAWNASGEYDASGMTAAQKYDACLSPFDGQKFEIKSVGITDDNGTKKVTVAVPVPDGTRSDRKIVVDYSTDKTFQTKQSADVGNAGTVEIEAPASGAVFYRLRATDVTPAQ